MKGLIFFVIVLIGAGIFLTVHFKEKNFQARKEAYLLNQNRKAAADHLNAFRKLSAEIDQISNDGQKLAGQVNDLLNAALGFKLDVPKSIRVTAMDLGPEPAPVEPMQPAPGPTPKPAAPTPAPAPGAATQNSDTPFGEPTREQLDARRAKQQGLTPAAPEPAAPAVNQAPKPPPPPPPPPPKPSFKSDDAPFGEPTREELESKRAKKEDKPPAPAPEEARKPQSQPEPEAPPPAPIKPPPSAKNKGSTGKTDGSPLATEAQKVMDTVGKIEDLVTRKDEASTKAEEAFQRANDAATSTEAAEQATRVKEQAELAKGMRDEAKTQYELAKKGLKTVDELKTQHDRDVEARKKAELKQQAEEAHRVLVQQELKKAEETEKQVLPAIEKYDYLAAAQSIDTAMAGLTTDEGKQALQVIRDRVGRLVEMKKFLIDQFNAQSIQWGWKQDGPVGKDVLGAAESEIRITGRSVPWTEVTPKQFLFLLDACLAKKELRLSLKGDHYLAAALYCHYRAMTEPKEAYAKKSTECSDKAASEVKRLLPQ
jgi:hypothetical protein